MKKQQMNRAALDSLLLEDEDFLSVARLVIPGCTAEDKLLAATFHSRAYTTFCSMTLADREYVAGKIGGG